MYGTASTQFWSGWHPEQELPTKVAASHVIRIYDPTTNTFGPYNPTEQFERSSNLASRVLVESFRHFSMMTEGTAVDGYVYPVCGFHGLTEPPRSIEGGSYEICASCGFEFGVTDDDKGFSYLEWRKKWIDEGDEWRKKWIDEGDALTQ